MTDQIVIVQEAGMADKLFPKSFLGFDVSKDWIDVERRGGAGVAGTGVVRIANEEAAIAAFLAGEPPVALAAFEPTGGYERRLRRALLGAGVAFARVHPNEVAGFRARRGVKAKHVLGLAEGKTRGTDRIDARRRLSRCFSCAGERPSASARRASMHFSRARASDSPAGL